MTGSTTTRIGSATAHPRTRAAAAWCLVLLAPVFAELAFGSTPPQLWIIAPILVPVYGGGVLLIRELVRRTGRGWPSILLLGIAYELAEDGIGLQALTSPHLYQAAEWGPRILGFNSTYWEANLFYHVVFSVVIPIFVTERLFPDHGRCPYLGRGGMVAAVVTAVVGVVLLRVAIPPFEDPGYQAPWPFIAGCIVAIAVLGFLALRVVPPRSGAAGTSARVPPPVALIGISVMFTAIFFLPFVGVTNIRDIGIAYGPGAIVAMVAAAVAAGVALALLARWTASNRWRNGQAYALIAGAALVHLAFGLWANVDTVTDRLVVALLNVALAALIAWRLRVLSTRSSAEPTS